jgi:glucose-6-phosphate isomerase
MGCSALLSIWYNNFFGLSRSLIPYTQYLQKFLIYNKEQWKVMVKVWVETETVNYETGTIIWERPGTNAQHAFN